MKTTAEVAMEDIWQWICKEIPGSPENRGFPDPESERRCSMADMVNGYEIRWAEDKDWIPAMHMIWKTFLKYEAVDYTEEGIRNFHEFITDEHLYKSFRQGRYQMMVALDAPGSSERLLCGITIIWSLLFVDEEYHHRGVGRESDGRMSNI